MKTILYILLYSPFIEWTTLLEWFNKLIKYKTDAYQFLLYFNKVWISDRNIWHVGEKPSVLILTNCALESYHKRLNSVLNTQTSIESFSKSLYLFDMKNFREINKCKDKILNSRSATF